MVLINNNNPTFYFSFFLYGNYIQLVSVTWTSLFYLTFRPVIREALSKCSDWLISYLAYMFHISELISSQLDI